MTSHKTPLLGSIAA